MKKRLFVLAVMLLFTCIHVTAQKSGSRQSYNQLSIGVAVADIENLVQTDALGADGKVQHTASFDMVLNDNEATKTIITAIQNAARSNIKSREPAGTGLQLVFSTINSTMTVTEQKTYTGITLDEIKLPDLNATDQSVAKITVRLHAATVNIMQPDGKPAAAVSIRNTNAIVSFFRVTMGSLPCSRISKVSGASIRPVSGQPQNFTVELSGVDGPQWNQWFLTGAGGVKKEQGTIELLGRDMKTVLFTMQLNDIEIISYSLANTANVARATVGLQVRSVALK